MNTISKVIHSILPDGSNINGRSWARCPGWPPDLFAVAATIAELSGFYSNASFTAPWRAGEYLCTRNYLKQVVALGKRWAATASLPLEVQDLWSSLVRSGRRSLSSKGTQDWHLTTLKLLAIADEASMGLGFGEIGKKNLRLSEFQRLFVVEHMNLLDRQRPQALRNLFESLCVMVPPDIVCVQPKTNTPTVGCTLRSLSHHLSLLPSRRVVSTGWALARMASEPRRPLNVLLVPYPYAIDGVHFRATKKSPGQEDRFFQIDQGWLSGANHGDALAKFVLDLITEAKRDVGEIHAVIFPEAALTVEMAFQIADQIASAEKGLELFIAGAIFNVSGSKQHSLNVAVARSYFRGTPGFQWVQTKHHRWCLDREQIRRYHLGHVLDPEHRWWEQIDVDDRHCFFTVVRPGASLAVLICEDLARFDPVLPVLNSVGPNLVIALLMDGPQMERRWPGRYATVLADDPGSSVLTLTSFGLVRRSSMPGQTEDHRVGLWKQAGGTAQELELPMGSHALALTLTVSETEQFTMDGRSDRGTAKRLRLFAARGIKAKQDHPLIRLD